MSKFIMLNLNLNKKPFLILFVIGLVGGLIGGILGVIPFVKLILICICFLLPFASGGVGWYATKAHKVTKSNLLNGLIIGALGGLAIGIPYSIISSTINGLFSLITGTAIHGLTTLNESGGNDFMMNDGRNIVTIFIKIILSFIFTNTFMVIFATIGGILAAATNHTMVQEESKK